ncbi:MAG: hypothetical protein P4L86_14580, partial [Mycobacterium sp.]|nr:hypothetical protein [Mycobacterium sp.]
DQGQQTTTYTLTAAGEALAVQVGALPPSHFTYDGDHDVTSAQDPNGNQTTYFYHYVGPNGVAATASGAGATEPEAGQTIGLIGAVHAPDITTTLDGSTSTVATTYAYDPVTNDLTQVIEPSGGEVDYTYNGHHQVLTAHEEVTAPINECGQAVPHAAKRIAPADCIVQPATWRDTTNDYNPDGTLRQVTDGRGNLWAYDYDAFGDLVQSTTPPAQVSSPTHQPTQTTPITTTYQRDADGQATQVSTAPEGQQPTLSYDHLGRLWKTVLPAVDVAGGGQTAPATTVVFDADGRVIRQRDALGHTTQDWYDPQGRLLAEQAPGTGRVTDYTYNATERIEVTVPGGSNSTPRVTTSYLYDASGRLQKATDPAQDVTYQRDANGNATTITRYGNGQPGTVTSQQFDGENKVAAQSISLTQFDKGDAVTTTQSVRLAYDQLGDPT